MDANGQAAPISVRNASNHTVSPIQGVGEMADRVRAHTWNETPIGAIEQWPPELVTMVNMMLSSKTITAIYWGPERVMIYNDCYLPQLGYRHPALGRPLRDVWPDVIDQITHLLQPVFETGKATHVEDVPLMVSEDGVLTERIYTLSTDPIWVKTGEGIQVHGAYHTATNNTAKVLADRQLRASEAQATRVLKSIGDGVIVTDAGGRISRMNAVAEGLTAWSESEAKGQPLASIFRIIDEKNRRVVESPADKVKRHGSVVGLANHTILLARDGREIPIDDSGAPIATNKAISPVSSWCSEMSRKNEQPKELQNR